MDPRTAKLVRIFEGDAGIEGPLNRSVFKAGCRDPRTTEKTEDENLFADFDLLLGLRVFRNFLCEQLDLRSFFYFLSSDSDWLVISSDSDWLESEFEIRLSLFSEKEYDV